MLAQPTRKVEATIATRRRDDREAHPLAARAPLDVSQLLLELACGDLERHAQVLEGVLGLRQPPREALPHGFARGRLLGIHHLGQRLARLQHRSRDIAPVDRHACLRFGYTPRVSSLPRTLIVAGAILVLLGLVLHANPSIPLLGKLPGDVRIERPGLRVYIPVTTCILVSVVLSALLWLLSKLR